MQSAAAKSATPGFQSFVQFLVSLGVEEVAATAVANKHDNHAKLLVCLYSFVKGATCEEVRDHVSEYLSLSGALDGALLELTKDILEEYFLGARASISDGMNNPSVKQFRRKMLQCAYECTNGYCNPRQTVALDDFVLQCSVTISDLIDTKGTPAGVMGVFREVLREHIRGAIPKATALLEHVLGHVDPALLEPVLAAAAQITASRKRVRAEDPEVIQEPDHAALRCDETIDDLDRESCSDSSALSADDSAVSADHEEASGYTTPPPTKMSKLDRFRLNCAPLKMPRLE